MISIYRRLKDYRDLLLVFIWREFSIRYKQSLIGVMWAVLQPLSMMLLFTFLFTFIMPVKVTDHPYILFFYSGSLPWSFFCSSLNYAIPSLTNQYNLVTKIYFPREILPISGIGVAFLDFLIASCVYVILIVVFKTRISMVILWVIPLLFLLVLFTVAVALVLSALNVYYRDVKLATGFLLQLWFFATPVFYSIDKLSLKMKLLVFINPLTFLVENMRRCVIGGRSVVLWQFVLVSVFILLFFFLSYRFFLNTEKKFADVI
jgi:ABC-type polysaccharide/polyol phosphate export permease